MANPNAQLQAAISQFANQPGVTPDQEAQLRAAITHDANLLQLLNQDAANDQLKGFALPQVGVARNLAGTYDMASGVVILPATSFQATGAVPNADLTATLRLQDMSLRFAHSNYVDVANVSQPVTQDMVSNLQSTINGSPVLAAQIKTAVTPTAPGQDAPLQHFAPLSGTVAGGTYNGSTHTMSLPPASLAVLASSFNSRDLTFVLAHEVQHGFNHPNKVAAYQAFDTQARQIAQDNNPINNYTAPIGQLIQAGREDEAKANIAGWNALLSREQQKIPAVGFNEMLATNNQRVLDFIELNQSTGLFQAKPGLIFNSDATLSQTPANVAAMGQYYFDKFPKGTPGIPAQQTTGIGFHGDSDYPNYYGAGAVSRAISFERAYAHPVNGVAPQMQVNLGQLRLSEALMERNGITLTTQPNTPQPYYDTSQSPPALHHFQHTNTTTGPNSHQHVPIEALPSSLSPSRTRNSSQDDPDQQPDRDARIQRKSDDMLTGTDPFIANPALAAATRSQRSADFRDPAHPGHENYERTLHEVHRMETTHGIQHGSHSERVAAALMVAAERNGLSVTNVEMGKDGQIHGLERFYAFAPEKKVTVDTNQALAQSMEQYSVQWSQHRSPHLVSHAPAAGRTPEQSLSLSQMSPGDHALFAKIREGAPPHMSDDYVAHATLLAKRDGITDASKLQGVVMSGDTLWVIGTTPGFRAAVNMSEQVPSMQETTQQAQAVNQHREEQLAQAMQRSPDELGRGALRM